MKKNRIRIIEQWKTKMLKKRKPYDKKVDDKTKRQKKNESRKRFDK